MRCIRDWWRGCRESQIYTITYAAAFDILLGLLHMEGRRLLNWIGSDEGNLSPSSISTSHQTTVTDDQDYTKLAYCTRHTISFVKFICWTGHHWIHERNAKIGRGTLSLNFTGLIWYTDFAVITKVKQTSVSKNLGRSWGVVWDYCVWHSQAEIKVILECVYHRKRL